MKWLWFCLAVGVLPSGGDPREASVAPITLYTQFQQDPPKVVLEALQDESESITSPMGLHLVFANTARRGSWGVGKATYAVQELLSEDLQFEERESQALRTSKARAALGNGGGTP